MKSLILVESPAKCNKILSFLDNNYMCEATFGHLRQLKSLKNINDNFDIEFNNIPEKEKQINKIKKKIKLCDEVIIATDDDREGEGIAWHVIKLFNLPLNVKRIKFNSITRDSIIHALNNPTQLDINMVDSQQTRQILDLFVGFKISPILWNEISRNNNLSAGRCQTPALHILYENYTKNKNTVPELSYNLYGYFTSKNLKFLLNKNFKDDSSMVEFMKLCNTFTCFQLKHEIKNNVEKKSPLPYITSTLQQNCSNLFNMSPKECMSICQKLYEGGHITYMRTDSYFLSDKFKNECKNFISTTYGENYCNKKYTYVNKKGSQDAHEAIRPTNIFSPPELQGKEDKIYKLIYKQTLKSLMSNAIIDIHTFIAPVNDSYYFYNTIEYIKFAGWMILDDIPIENYINYLSNINKITFNKIIGEPSFSNTSLYYTEAKLIKELEDKNIGRPSTFASIVEKLKDRKYVLKENVKGKKQKISIYELCNNKISKKNQEKIIGSEKNKLIIQPLGVLVIELLIKHFNELFNYKFTEEMENSLDEIANGKSNKYDTCNLYNTNINNYIIEYKKHDPNKIMIDDDHEFIISKNGPVIKYTKDKETIFKKIIPDFDIDKIKRKEYNIEDLIDNTSNEKIIGNYKEKDIIIKRGKFGNYIQYNNNNISLNSINKNFDEIIISDVIDLLDGNNSKSNIVREITNEISIRNGKYGNYIYYKTINMKKPKFINLKKLNTDYLNCEKTHIINYVNENI